MLYAARVELPAAQAEELIADLSVRSDLQLDLYARPHLYRSLQTRMRAVAAASCTEYRAYLESAPGEYEHLRRTLLNPHTELWRDAENFSLLRSHVAPSLLRRNTSRRVRVWSAGCSTGEEPYSLAMLFADLVGVHDLSERVHIRATDVSRRALAVARCALYCSRTIAALPPPFAERYFEPDGQRHRLLPALVDSVTFAAHDLLRDPPLHRFDVITCLNTLMYFTREGQRRALSCLYLSLADDGVLFVALTDPAATGLFVRSKLGRHIYQRRPGCAGQAITMLFAPERALGPETAGDLLR